MSRCLQSQDMVAMYEAYGGVQPPRDGKKCAVLLEDASNNHRGGYMVRWPHLLFPPAEAAGRPSLSRGFLFEWMLELVDGDGV